MKLTPVPLKETDPMPCEASAMRAKKLAAIRKRIQAGTYRISSEEIATALMDRLRSRDVDAGQTVGGGLDPND